MQKLVVFLLFCLPASVLAQSAGGVAGISGIVHDSSGAVLQNAMVVISSASQGQVRSLTTNDAGVFTAPGLIPGPGYQVTVNAQGFAAYELTNINLQVGQNVNLNVNMAVAQSTNSVQVSAVALLVDDSRADVSQVVGERDIMNLPINGRRVDQFVLDTPGVSNDATFGLLSFRGVAGNNAFLLDGNDNTEQFYDENAGRTRIASQVSADAVQEFQVVSANFSAEYGRAMGGVVNTVTKSGSNAFHGGAFYFLRSTGFDARDPYSVFNPTEHRIQTGATLSGPILKDKLFFFLSTDITRRNFPMTDSQVKVGVVDQNAQTWVGCTLPATPAQCAAINTLLPRFYGQIPRNADNDLYFGRLDYHLNDRNTFSASFNFLRWLSPNGIQTGLSSTVGAAITGNGDDTVTVRNGKATWTSVLSSSLVNQFRYGLDTDRQADSFDQAELGGGLGYLDVAVGGATASAGVQLGPATYLPRVEPMETRNEFADDLTWTKGKHTFKFGANYVNSQDNVNYLSNRFGSYTYLTPTLFAEDYSGNVSGAKNWTAYSQTFGNPIVDYWIRELGVYLEDQWRVTDRLTITLGARYEHSFVEQPAVSNPAWPETGHVHTGTLDLMPRIGFAYKVNDKTVVRGGYGTFFARFLGGLMDNLFTTNGVYQIADSLTATNPAQLAAGPVFPNALAAPPTGASVAASTIQFAAPNLKTPYSEQAQLTVERGFGQDMLLSVSGIWSRGVNLYGVTDLNAPPLGPNFTYLINDANGNQVGTYTTPIYLNPRPNTAFAGVYETTNGVSSFYDALTVTFNKRFSHGFQSLASYSWAHEIDDGQGGGSNAIFFSTPTSTFNGDYGFDKGSGLLDQRHRLVFSFVWSPTFVHRDGAFYKYVVNNWQLSSIMTLASGRPAGSPSVRLTDTPVKGMLSTNSLNGFNESPNRVPFLPVDSLYTPPTYRDDLRLTKNFPVTEQVNVQ